MWNSNTQYRATVWQCNEKYHGNGKCATPSLRTETIEDAFVMAINQVLGQKDAIIRIAEQVMAERCNTDAIQCEQDKAQSELEIITGLMERLIAMNASVAMDQNECNRQFAEYEGRYNAAKQRLIELDAERVQLTAKRGQLAEYLEALKAAGPITHFDETLWHGTVEQLRVMADGKLRFIFKDGKELAV